MDSPNIKKFLHTPHPELTTVWLGVLSVCALLIIVGAVYAGLLFKRVLVSDTLPENVPASLSGTINREEFMNVLLSFRQRAAEFNRRSTTPPTVSDPSR